MTDAMSAADYLALQATKTKFGNQRSGKSDSKAEARTLAAAELRVAAGELVGTSPQPSLVYGINEKGQYRRVRPDRMDVLEHFEDGSMRVRFLDTKGRRGKRAHGRHGTDTEASQAKRAALRLHGVIIVIEEG